MKADTNPKHQPCLDFASRHRRCSGCISWSLQPLSDLPLLRRTESKRESTLSRENRPCLGGHKPYPQAHVQQTAWLTYAKSSESDGDEKNGDRREHQPCFEPRHGWFPLRTRHPVFVIRFTVFGARQTCRLLDMVLRVAFHAPPTPPRTTVTTQGLRWRSLWPLNASSRGFPGQMNPSREGPRPHIRWESISIASRWY